MAKHGGKREGAGRRSKADEAKIIESMDAVLAPAEAWRALASKVRRNDVQAIKVWMAYRYGQPKQQINADITLSEVIVDFEE